MTRLLLAGLLTLLLPPPAHAYVDPGSGMLVWQGLLALVGGLIMLVRQPTRSIKLFWDWLRRRR